MNSELFLEEIDYLTAKTLPELTKKVNKEIEDGEGFVEVEGSPTFINGEYIQLVKYFNEEA